MQGIFEPHLSTDSGTSYMRGEIVYVAFGGWDAAGAKAHGLTGPA